MGAVTISSLSSRCGITNPGGNSTASSMVEPLPMVLSPETDPVTSGVVAIPDGVIPWGAGGSEGTIALMLMFFGVGANGTSFNANVYGWEQVEVPVTGLGSTLWVPHPLVTLTGITLSSSLPGILNTLVPATNYFASAITLNLGNSGISCEIVSPGSGTTEVAHAVIDAKGCRYIEVRYNMNSSATSGNAVWKRL